MNKYNIKTKTVNQSKTGQFFQKFPTCLIPHIKDAGTLLMHILFRLHLNKGWQFHRHEISEQLNQSLRQTMNQIEILKKLGLLTVEGPNGQQFYQFNRQQYEKYLN